MSPAMFGDMPGCKSTLTETLALIQEVFVMNVKEPEAPSDYWTVLYRLVHEAREGPWAVK